MKSGIKYVDGMDLHGVIKAGLEDFELDYTGCKSADMILENGGNIDGIAISLCDFTDKGFLKENASQIFKDAMSVADRYNAYIVIDTENVKKASVLEQIIDECVNEIAASDVNVFIENGYTNENGRFYHNDYSDGPRLIQLVDKLNLLVAADSFGICINVGHANLLGINVRDMVSVCGKKTGIVHINDNDGNSDYHQMPYTFTTGRGVLSTDWGNIIGDLSKVGFCGSFIFDMKGTFTRTPRELHKVMAELLVSMYKEWQESCFKTEEYLAFSDKKIILFGAGRMALNYMQAWGEKYPPSFIVYNNSELWGQTRWGIPIKSPDDILLVPENQRNVWICNMYYDAIGAQLDNMGIEYRCYWDHYYM